jgi:hypothetical protein
MTKTRLQCAYYAKRRENGKKNNPKREREKERKNEDHTRQGKAKTRQDAT